MIKMTKTAALAKQAEQVAWYSGIYGQHVADLVAAATTADALKDGVEYDMVTINRHIPRGSAIEALIPWRAA